MNYNFSRKLKMPMAVASPIIKPVNDPIAYANPIIRSVGGINGDGKNSVNELYREQNVGPTMNSIK